MSGFQLLASAVPFGARALGDRVNKARIHAFTPNITEVRALIVSRPTLIKTQCAR